MWQRALPVGVITIISILYFLNIGSSLSFAEKKPSPTETVSGPDFSNGLYGTWTGTENDEPVRVVFEKMEEPNQFKMVMNKNNGSKTEITGNFDTSQGVLSDLNLSDLKKKGSQPIEGKLTLTKNKIEGEITISKKESIRNKIDLEYVPGT